MTLDAQLLGSASFVPGTWKNWYENLSCFAYIVDAHCEDDVIAAVRFAAQKGLKVRVAGTGHSNVALVPNAGMVIITDNLKGLVSHDKEHQTATLWGGTKIHDMGDMLWDVGLGLSNQGDIDSQSIAGAISTGTHGTGLSLTNLSSRIVSMRIVDARGEVIVIDGSDERRLRAARVSLGLLGVITQVTMKVSKAYSLHEWIGIMPYEKVVALEQAMHEKYRHFTYFWCALPSCVQWLGVDISTRAPEAFTNCCYVRIFDPDPIDVGELETFTWRRRHDRSYRIYAEVYTKDFDEMEYMIPLEHAQACFREIITDQHEHFSKYRFPVEMRVTAGDDNYLSEYQGQARAAISLAGRMHKNDVDFFRACDRIFAKYQGRSHWAKVNFLDQNRLREVYPRFQDFVDVRREMDPEGRFLNEYLAPKFE